MSITLFCFNKEAKNKVSFNCPLLLFNWVLGNLRVIWTSIMIWASKIGGAHVENNYFKIDLFQEQIKIFETDCSVVLGI
jgi:hypothetical protein